MENLKKKLYHAEEKLESSDVKQSTLCDIMKTMQKELDDSKTEIQRLKVFEVSSVTPLLFSYIFLF